MKKLFMKILCVGCIITLFATVSLPSQAASVYYEFPFKDHEHWYTPVDGSTDGFSYGYLDSPTKFLDYTYKDGIASIFLTDNIGKLRAYMYGSSGGWPSLYYTYDEAVELDLTSVAFQYKIAAQTYWRITIVLENADGEGTTPIYLDQMDSNINIETMSAVPQEERIIYENSFDFLNAIRKNYVSKLSDIGLDKGNTVKLKGIEIMFKCSPTNLLWATNDIHTLRLVKDSSIATRPVNSSADSSQQAEAPESSEKFTASNEIQEDNYNSEAHSSSSSLTSSSSEVTDSETEHKETDRRTWIIILAVFAGIALAGAVTAVILVNGKKNRNKTI